MHANVWFTINKLFEIILDIFSLQKSCIHPDSFLSNYKHEFCFTNKSVDPVL